MFDRCSHDAPLGSPSSFPDGGTRPEFFSMILPYDLASSPRALGGEETDPWVEIAGIYVRNLRHGVTRYDALGVVMRLVIRSVPPS